MIKLDFNLKRPLYPPSAPDQQIFMGEDVLAIKRVISRLGFWQWQEFDEVYSEAFAKGLKNKGRIVKGSEGVIGAQRKFKVDNPSGNYGNASHEAFLNARVPKGLPHDGDRAWDQASINLYQGFKDYTAAERIVTEIFSWWDWGVQRTPAWHYSQDRPIQPLRSRERPPQLPSWSDCSGTAIYMAWLADARSPDPIFGFSGNGWTGSLIGGGFQISTDNINKYSSNHYVLAFFGPSRYNTKDVIAVKNSRTYYSNGSESGPKIYTYLTQGRDDFIECRAYPVI